MIDIQTLKQSVRGKTVLIDSNIIIYLTEKTKPFHDISQALFSLVEDGECRAIISILSVAEVMQGPLRAGRDDIAMAVKNYLVNFPNCDCQHITPDVLEYVGQDQRVTWKTLRTVDSLIIASGLHAQADLFISNDAHFIKSLPADMLVTFSG
ncbi:MAG: type II toxin-antitoxin system VapC family toxin [Desulfotignum sp.]|nr:type II toxin-antitoxin system VapC family toxin [Desulfotignum sp.]MCF8114698.1 type II toxin-antitoxin system VapC family toxin [Desulfotignum sp.]MCF8139414.1 type II toxin-antitoxin system VapC family toxin [Desulfotignum sp.]